MEQLHRAEIDVEIEPEPEAQQDVSSVLVAGDSWIAERAQKDRVHVVAQVTEGRVRERLPGLKVMIGAVGETLPCEREPVLGGGPVEHGHCRLDHLGADAVPSDHGDAVRDA